MVRFVVFLVVLGVLFPANLSSRRSAGGIGDPLSVGDLMIAAKEIHTDLSGLCERRPTVCDTGVRLGLQARERAIGWLEDAVESLDAAEPPAEPVLAVPLSPQPTADALPPTSSVGVPP